MNFHIISIFPESFESYINASIIKRARDFGLIKINIINPRVFTNDKHNTMDDNPYGGGVGMVLKAEPIIKAADEIISKTKEKTKVIILSPNGSQFDNKKAKFLAKQYKNIILICGKYEGIDERVKKALKAEEVSAGPYILSGGELPALIIIDAVSRQIKGVLGKKESLEESREVRNYPLYTRPEEIVFKGKKYKTPKTLLSGNHKKIEEWRKKNVK